MSHACHLCGADASNRCARCLGVYYCSRECQSTDWRTHKATCVKKETKEPKKDAGVAAPNPTEPKKAAGVAAPNPADPSHKHATGHASARAEGGRADASAAVHQAAYDPLLEGLRDMMKPGAIASRGVENAVYGTNISDVAPPALPPTPPPSAMKGAPGMMMGGRFVPHMQWPPIATPSEGAGLARKAMSAVLARARKLGITRPTEKSVLYVSEARTKAEMIDEYFWEQLNEGFPKADIDMQSMTFSHFRDRIKCDASKYAAVIAANSGADPYEDLSWASKYMEAGGTLILLLGSSGPIVPAARELGLPWEDVNMFRTDVYAKAAARDADVIAGCPTAYSLKGAFLTNVAEADRLYATGTKSAYFSASVMGMMAGADGTPQARICPIATHPFGASGGRLVMVCDWNLEGGTYAVLASFIQRAQCRTLIPAPGSAPAAADSARVEAPNPTE